MRMDIYFEWDLIKSSLAAFIYLFITYITNKILNYIATKLTSLPIPFKETNKYYLNNL